MNHKLMDTFQIKALRVIGTSLRVLSFIFPSTRECFQPFGFGLLSRFIGNALFDRENQFTISLGKGSEAHLSFYLNDMYWSSLLIPGADYESEIREVLDRVLIPGVIFIDCGANIGYWSVYATTCLKQEEIIAVEAFSPTYDQLRRNAELNGGFQCILAALSDSDGDEVWLGGNNHASMSLQKGQTASKGQGTWIKTITLDTIYRRFIHLQFERIVVKLDVEGMETRVLSQALELLDKKPLIIFEEHGKDKECITSLYLSENLGYKLYRWDNDMGLLELNIDAIKKFKRNKRVGYNFFACHPESDWFN